MIKEVFSFITGGNRNANKIVDGAIKGLDAAWYTDEERAATYSHWSKQQLDENSIRSKSRRILAFAILGCYLGMKVASVAVYKIDIEYAKHIGMQADSIKWLALGVGGFYFYTHVLRAKK